MWLRRPKRHWQRWKKAPFEFLIPKINFNDTKNHTGCAKKSGILQKFSIFSKKKFFNFFCGKHFPRVNFMQKTRFR